MNLNGVCPSILRCKSRNINQFVTEKLETSKLKYCGSALRNEILP